MDSHLNWNIKAILNLDKSLLGTTRENKDLIYTEHCLCLGLTMLRVSSVNSFYPCLYFFIHLSATFLLSLFPSLIIPFLCFFLPFYKFIKRVTGLVLRRISRLHFNVQLRFSGGWSLQPPSSGWICSLWTRWHLLYMAECGIISTFHVAHSESQTCFKRNCLFSSAVFLLSLNFQMLITDGKGWVNT